jgi:hypothetical protein
MSEVSGVTSTTEGAEAVIGSLVMPTLLAGGHRATASPGVWSVFTVPNYRRFVAGQSISLVGSCYLPVLLLTPYAGLIIDRHDKRRLLMLTSAVLGLTRWSSAPRRWATSSPSGRSS